MGRSTVRGEGDSAVGKCGLGRERASPSRRGTRGEEKRTVRGDEVPPSGKKGSGENEQYGEGGRSTGSDGAERRAALGRRLSFQTGEFGEAFKTEWKGPTRQVELEVISYHNQEATDEVAK